MPGDELAKDAEQPFLNGSPTLADTAGQLIAEALKTLSAEHPEARIAEFSVAWDGVQLTLMGSWDTLIH
jgi:hypothetical protein